jgi:YidC/Oxa1 family membrane protein insertase
MDKRTLLAIVLSVVVVSGSFVLQNVFFPPHPTTVTTAANPSAPVPTPGTPTPAATPVAASGQTAQTSVVEIAPKTVVLENEVMRVTVSNEGAVATSIELKKHLEDGKPVQMVNAEKGVGAAFETSFGGFDAEVLKVPFEVSQTGTLSWKFSRPFVDKGGNAFTFTKTFTLQPNEYIIKVEVGTTSANGSLPVLSQEPVAYTLTYGPQLGPHFVKIDGSQEIRKYYKFNGNNRSEDGLNLETKSTEETLKWAAISGKYFTVAGIPDSTAYKTIFSNKHRTGDTEVSRLAFSRPVLKSSTTVDTFYFYVGPKEEKTLRTYSEAGTNGFHLSGLKLEQTMEDNWLLGWLQVLLKWALEGFYFLIPNWGIGIILVTLVIKLATWPLTAKSYRANAAMQSLQPKLKELQEKYKDDPKKLNEQTMGLYQKEGVNPLGGCLPMLLQIPVFFALYGMFNTEFSFRGAAFIAGWIPDLSLPDSVLHFSYVLPLINLHMSGLHLLPFIMVATQIWTSMLSQPTGGMNSQMKIMTFGLPFIFLFMLYEMPSGLMVYWCVQNILTVVQQWFINTHFKKVPPKSGPNLKLAPKKSGNKIAK